MSHNSVPQFNPDEPYYIFRRKLDQYFISQQIPKLTDTINLMNLLLNTDHTHILEFTKIMTFPSVQQIDDIIDKHVDLCKRLHIKKKEIDDTFTFMNSILKKVGFTLIKCGTKNTYYRIKTTTN